MIRRLIPYPLLAASLLIMWLMLMQTVSLGQVLLGALVALVATWSMTRIHPSTTPIANWGKVIRLMGLVIVDVARSNLAVARIVLASDYERNSSFLRIPLELRNTNALACLALIITATPGSAWVNFDRNSRMLVIHVFDLVDEEHWIRLLKSRYEILLLEIFES